MLPLCLAVVLFVLMRSSALLRLLKAFLVVVPGLFAASAMAHWLPPIDLIGAKLVGFGLVTAVMGWVWGRLDPLALCLLTWAGLELSGRWMLGQWPDLSQYIQDGNWVFFAIILLAALCLPGRLPLLR